MSFNVYPAPPSAPLSVPAAAAGPLVEIAEHVSVDPATGRTVMIARVVQVDAADGHSPSSPSVRLAVDDGAPTTVGPQPTPLHTQAGGATPAALATLSAATADDIHVVEIEVLQLQRRWRMQIANTDTVDHRYTWVVGDTDAATLQPWLDVPVAALTFDSPAGETTPAQDLPLANYGPGPLTVHDPDGAALGSGFRLVTITPRTIGGNRRAIASIAFTAPNTPGTPSTTHALASSDPVAGPTTGHNNRVALAATVRPLWTVSGTVRISDTLDHGGNPAYELDEWYAPLLISGTLRNSGSVRFSVQIPQFIPVGSDRAVGVWIKLNGTEHARFSNWMMSSPIWKQIGPIPLRPGPFEFELTSGEGDGAGWPHPTKPVLAGDIRVTLDP